MRIAGHPGPAGGRAVAGPPPGTDTDTGAVSGRWSRERDRLGAVDDPIPAGEVTGMASSRGARALIVVALLYVLGLAAWSGRTVWADSGSFVLVLFGVPVVCTAVALWAERRSRTMLAPAVVAALAGVSLWWALLTALGIGLVLVPPSVLLLLAALVSWLHRAGRDTAASPRA